MKTAFALALVAGASAQLALYGIMPFLLMDGLGGGNYYYSAPAYGHHGGHGRYPSYYSSSRGGLGDIGMLAALGGLGGAGAGLTASNAAYLVASQNGGFNDNLPLLAASGAFGADFLGGGNAALPLLMSGGGFGGDSMALLAATGGLGVDSSSMMLPLMVNSMSYGRSPSLSRDVIPAMALTGMTPTTENLLPFMMTSGGRYMGGNYGLLAAAGGLGGVTSDAMMPWLLADSYGSRSYYGGRHMGHMGHMGQSYAAPRVAHAGHVGHAAPRVAHAGHVGHAAPRVAHAGHLGHGFGHGIAAPRTVVYSTAAAPALTTLV